MRGFYFSALSIILISLLHFDAKCQKTPGFTLKGKLDGLGNYAIYLVVGRDTVSQTYGKNDFFQFSGVVEGGGRIFIFSLPH